MSTVEAGLKQSKYLNALHDDFIGYGRHVGFDEEVKRSLEDVANQRLAQPQTIDDYLDLVKLILEKHPVLMHRNPVKVYLRVFKANYFEESGEPGPAWDDFKRLVDICLKARRFRSIRLLGKSGWCLL